MGDTQYGSEIEDINSLSRRDQNEQVGDPAIAKKEECLQRSEFKLDLSFLDQSTANNTILRKEVQTPTDGVVSSKRSEIMAFP